MECISANYKLSFETPFFLEIPMELRHSQQADCVDSTGQIFKQK